MLFKAAVNTVFHVDSLRLFCETCTLFLYYFEVLGDIKEPETEKMKEIKITFKVNHARKLSKMCCSKTPGDTRNIF